MKILVSDNLEQGLIDVLTREGFEVDNKTGLSALILRIRAAEVALAVNHGLRTTPCRTSSSRVLPERFSADVM